MSPSSDDLLTRFAAGDSAAFDELVASLAPRLKGYFLRQGAQSSTAEDLVQNVFVRLLQNASRYQASGRLDAFCLRIARNLWIDHCRRGGRVFSSDEAFDRADPRPGPVQMADSGDRAGLLRLALEQLDADTRELLELAVLQQLPYREVSVILEIPVGTVKSRVYYSLRKLRDHLHHLGPQEDLS
ncbi:MAG: RNA polymerase sigma factor [Planctomycetota bacterium]|jgi:RNA polymerase sigma-70 factor (ECF subfamily)|nr:RNA polymerase sigma factor [Planctomycetota bacterium]